MSKIEINKLTNANIYMNGTNLLGRAEEVQLPQIKHKMAEHKALGMVGSAEFFAGIDKLECKINPWGSYGRRRWSKSSSIRRCCPDAEFTKYDSNCSC